jgi:hypothetical protein
MDDFSVFEDIDQDLVWNLAVCPSLPFALGELGRRTAVKAQTPVSIVRPGIRMHETA